MALASSSGVLPEKRPMVRRAAGSFLRIGGMDRDLDDDGVLARLAGVLAVVPDDEGIIVLPSKRIGYPVAYRLGCRLQSVAVVRTRGNAVDGDDYSSSLGVPES